MSGSSLVSLPITNFNVPEPASIEGEFVYNFYLPDEDRRFHRTPTSPFPDSNDTLVSKQNAAAIEQNEAGAIRTRVPRYIKISITGKVSGDVDVVTVGDSYPTPMGPVNLEQSPDEILYEKLVINKRYNIEGKLENDYVASAVMSDASAKSRVMATVYRVSTAKITNGSILGETSDLDIATQLDEMTSDDVEGTTLINMIAANNQISTIYANDVSGEVRNPLDDKASVRYYMKFNPSSYRKFTKQISQANPFSHFHSADTLLVESIDATGISPNPLLDSVSHPEPPRAPDMEKLVPQLLPLYVGESRYYPPLTAESLDQNGELSQEEETKLDEGQWDEIRSTNPVGIPNIAFIGYVLEKEGVSSKGEVDGPFQPLVLLGPNQTEFLDPNIKYGWTYTYRARQLFLIHGTQILPEASITAQNSLGENIKVFRVADYVYAVASRSPTPLTITAKEKTPPPAPSVIWLDFIYQKGNGLAIRWDEPVNPSRDIKKYQVFRRKTIQDPFELIVEYDFRDDGYTQFVEYETPDENLVKKSTRKVQQHVDPDFSRESSYIYTVASVDAHGMLSPYGTQLYAKFNKISNKLEIKKISDPGAPRAYPNIAINPAKIDEISINRIVEDVARDSNHSTMRIYFNPTTYNFKKGPAQSDEQVVLNKSAGIYKFQIINLDRQKTKVLDIEIDPTFNSAGIL